MKNMGAHLVVAATAVALLAGCGAGDGDNTAVPASEASAPATEVAVPTEAPPSPTEDITEEPTDVDETAADDSAAGGTQPAVVALSLDERGVPIASACTGADGAVVVTTEGEVMIMLVREEGTALRYVGEGMTAETSDVTVEQVGVSTVYRATLQSDQVPAVDVTLELGDTSVLEECRA